MTDQTTLDEITNWATNKYAGSASPSLSAASMPSTAPASPASGMLGAPAPGTTAPAAAATTPPSTWSSATGAVAPGAAPSATSTMLGGGASVAPASTTAPAAAALPSTWDSAANPTKQYNGQNVMIGQGFMDNLNSSVANYNKTTGKNLTAQEYDKMLNPNTYGARWGIADPGAGSGTGTKFDTNPAVGSGPTLLDPATLAQRTIDAKNETVRGQLGQVLAEDSPVLQQARADAMRSANERGMLNSTMATSGAQDAVIRSALQIASPDAAAYGHAADYNAAATNQAKMYNSTAQNDFAKQGIQLAADKAAQSAQLKQQMSVAQMQDATSRFAAETSSATSKYNTDSQYRQQADANKKTLTNNIIANMDLSPDRKAAMLESLGEGTSAKKNPDGSITPGTGLAGAVYVIDSIAADLNFGADYHG